MPTWRVAVRYAAFQVPGLVLVAVVMLVVREVFALPAWTVWAAVAGWAALDVALFPFLRIAYEEGPARGGAAALVGARGLARDRLEPSGYVRIGAELWRAELVPGSAPVAAGQEVRVREVRGLTLLVEALTASPLSPRSGRPTA
jgi:membrane protein implicated in regulation of membrane protease activity